MKLNKYNINYDDGIVDFYYRQDSVGDSGVLQQIFVNEDYRVIHWAQGKLLNDFYHARKDDGKIALIVDAGANIGASAVYFAKSYPASIVLAVEPEHSNATLLRVNVDKLNIKVFQAAIGCDNGEMFLHDPGQSDWGFRVGKSGDHSVKVVTPFELMSSVDGHEAYPFIFKIDIEGSEEHLFQKNIEWMDLYPLIIIELHDWMLPFQGSSRTFLKAISGYDFDIVYRGENLFCFNKKLLANSIA